MAPDVDTQTCSLISPDDLDPADFASPRHCEVKVTKKVCQPHNSKSSRVRFGYCLHTIRSPKRDLPFSTLRLGSNHNSFSVSFQGFCFPYPGFTPRKILEIFLWTFEPEYRIKSLGVANTPFFWASRVTFTEKLVLKPPSLL